MATKIRRDWGKIRDQVIDALRAGVPAEFQSLAKYIGIPATTLSGGLKREFGIQRPEELLGILGDGKPARVGVDVKEGENTMEISDVAPLVRTLDELLAACKVDLRVWEVRDYLVNQWQYGTKDGVIYPLYQVKAWLVRKKLKPLMPEIRPVRLGVKPVRKPRPKGSGVRRAMIVADAHFGFRRRLHTGELIPFHDRRVLDLALQILQVAPFDNVSLIGDWADLSEWSSKFTAEPEFYWTTQPMLIEASWWLSLFRQVAPEATIDYYEGNHEKRMRDLIAAYMKAAYDLRPADELHLPPALSMPRLLALDALGINYIGDYPDGRKWLNQNVVIRHGDTVRAGPGDSAKAVANKTTYTTVFGHVHRREMVSTRTQTREGDLIHVAFCPGCACHIDGRVPGSTSEDQWQQGIAIIEYTDQDENIIPVAIDKGRAIYNGRIFTARKRDREIDAMLLKKLQSMQ